MALTPEHRMREEDLTDPAIHARNETVVQWVSRAMRLAQDPEYDHQLLARGTAFEIIRLFY